MRKRSNRYASKFSASSQVGARAAMGLFIGKRCICTKNSIGASSKRRTWTTIWNLKNPARFRWRTALYCARSATSKNTRIGRFDLSKGRPACNRIEHRIGEGGEQKRCSTCKQYLLLDRFASATRSWDGLACRRDCMKQYDIRVEENAIGIRGLSYKLAVRLKHLRYRARLPQRETLEAYEAHLIWDGKCWVCGEECLEKDVVFDHDDDHKIFRGIGHDGCNTAVGLLRHDPQRIRAAATYIEENQETAFLFGGLIL